MNIVQCTWENLLPILSFRVGIWLKKIHSFLNLNIMRWKVCGRLRSERPLKPQLAKILLPYIWCWNRIMHSCGFEVVWCYEIWPAASFARISRSWIDRRSQATWEKPILKWRRLSDIQFLYNYNLKEDINWSRTKVLSCCLSFLHQDI